MQPATKKTILLVEDDESTRLAISMILTKHAAVLEASNPVEALETLKQHSVDLVITDIQMPMMSGIEFIKVLQTNDLSVPIIVVSGSVSPALKDELSKQNVAWIFEKPVEAWQLVPAIRKCLDKSLVQRIN